MVFVGDVLACVLALLASGRPTPLATATVVLVLVLLLVSGGYRARLTLSALDELPGLVARVCVATAGTVGIAVYAADMSDARAVLRTSAVLALLLPLIRAVAYAVVRRVRRRRLVRHRTLIVGAGVVGSQLAHALLEHPEHGLEPVGFVDSDPWLVKEKRPIPLLGGHDELADLIRTHDAQTILLAFGTYPEASIVDIVRTCDQLKCEMFFVPRLFELHSLDRDMDHVWGIPLVRLRRPAARSALWVVKRTTDRLVAAVALVVLSPVLAAVALAVRVSHGRGVLFRQVRVGLDGKEFELLKFRSLQPRDDTESATRWNVADDERMSRVGKLIRRTSLDELPQLWNVLRGDMSLVGPRPERPHFVDEFARLFPRYTARHRVPAGVTGWAQVNGLRGDTSIADRARFDNFYIENWSLWNDTKILVRTVTSALRGR
jgi:exopolysaccharide biosynthesis polyprenyl glycosylphosphotransferase